MSENDAILKVNGLKTYFYQASGVSKAVDGVSFTLKEGTTMGIVGESGSGKSVTSASVMRLMPAKTGKIVNIKKGQFLSPESMKFAVDKVRESGDDRVMVTERGTTFGYQDLIVDYRGISIMQQACQCPVVVDVTHSLQQPNQASGVTGGQPALIETIAKAGIAVGADGIFIETHADPRCAKSDGANMLRLDLIEGLLERLVRIREAIK